ncbi:hypothetical protein O6H91_15G043400 [Diphasiastrum complanatum]|uniref:Uncharacterized protein n=1 Tax=Diphasiastrum complanatum TaxID=34168 RepID=A0ACC2BHT6_DIPCM|nr:hypothetical protein O6H91_15G043400 [Diphasiastrum complanatum]
MDSTHNADQDVVETVINEATASPTSESDSVRETESTAESQDQHTTAATAATETAADAEVPKQDDPAGEFVQVEEEEKVKENTDGAASNVEEEIKGLTLN